MIELQFTEISTGASFDLNSVTVRGNKIFIAGGLRYDSAFLSSSVDGGVSWTPTSYNFLNANKALYNISFLSTDTAFASGYDGNILTTNDAGSTWKLIQTWWWPIRNFHFFDSKNFIAVGGSGWQHGQIYHSHDGGMSWSVDTFNNELRNFFFPNSSTGYACGYGCVLKSTDGGATWDYTNVKGDLFMSIYFTDENTGVCCGFTGTILRTTDGGSHWKKIRNGNSLLVGNKTFNQVIFRNPLIGYIVGDGGTFWKTIDGGEHWEVVKNAPAFDMRAITLTSTGGYVVGVGGKMFQFVD